MAMAGAAAVGRALLSRPQPLLIQCLDLSAGANSGAVVFRRIVFRASRILLARRDTARVRASCAMLREQRLPHRAGRARGSGLEPQCAMARGDAFFPGRELASQSSLAPRP